ncbi:efflux RND transporter periplasmic adaptor subunit [Achromobacter aloeverae]|uniref:Efflux transporter periplasmic adaptor subunit n=1 Tax=Achromobacter aloeverae TaxID=1750518 RepID=A0A4Q1HHK6_9BURK|nr:efflux RND transporter periplasmic adaptor subunit [Achromobacter aloeverae]RXN86859.1 efflux transporter periplasmic adaptor subunit [Achromobacter aloeverae]
MPATRRLPSPATSLFATALALALTACDPPAQHAPAPPAEVGVVTVTPRSVELTDEYNGRVEAVNAARILPRVGGYLDRVAYKEGEQVAQGAVLFVIDQRPYRIALDRAQAQLQRARATARLAQVQFKRVSALYAARATSQEELDTTRAAAEQARADEQAAEAAVADARLNLDYTEVRAPVAGRAGRAMLTAGNLAVANQSLLTSVVAQDPVYVYFDCDEQSYLRYTAARGASQDRAISANMVRVGLANEAGFPHAGRVDFLDNQVDPVTGTIRARVRLDNPGGIFTPGLYARVQLVTGTAPRALLVDDKAVLTDQDRKYLYVVSADGKALRREVSVGRAVGGQRIIEAGLRDGDRVAVDGTQKVFYSGAPVKAVPYATQSASAK